MSPARRSAFQVLFVILLAGCCMLVAFDSLRARSSARSNGPLEDENNRWIRLTGHTFDPLQEGPALAPNLRSKEPGPNETGYCIVQFNDLVTPAMRAQVEETGAVLLHYIHENAFLTRATGKVIERARALPSVRWIGPYEPAYKLSAQLDLEHDAVLNQQLEELERKSPGRHRPRFDTRSSLAVVIMTMESDRVMEVVRAVRQAGGRNVVFSRNGNGLVRADIPRAALEPLAREPGVLWVERDLPAEADNDVARWVIQSNDSENKATPLHAHGLSGAGQTVTVTDTGVDRDHEAFHDTVAVGPEHRKITDYYNPNPHAGDGVDDVFDGHGTHVAGSVAGDAGVHGQYDGDGESGTGGDLQGPHDGQAFGARIHVQDISEDGDVFEPNPDVSVHFQMAMNRGSSINTNSWGRLLDPGKYTSLAAATDLFVWNNPQFTVLFSAGNRGPRPGLINTYGIAKNLITVGASGNGVQAGSPARFSARGPTFDGRLKPDVMAPGVGIWSARGCDALPPDDCMPIEYDTYHALNGTSMSTPMVAGAVALIREYFMNGWYPKGEPGSGPSFTPSAALIKATLVNSAAEMTGGGAYANGEDKYPNNSQGWGRILLDESIFFPGDERSLVVDDNAGIALGDTHTTLFVVGNPFEPLEVTLVWTDRPSIPLTTPDLVNDLDLVVTAPDGATVYLGNAYSGHAPGASVPNADPNAVDRRNNVESVLILPNVMIGTWTITVQPHTIPQPNAQGRQPYALVITGGQNTSQGVVAMDRAVYTPSHTVTVLVSDKDLNLNPNAAEGITVTISSDTETVAESLALEETSADSGAFSGTIDLQTSQNPVPGDGHLQVVHGDLITASYFDADDGDGGSVMRHATARVDNAPPVITGVAATEIGPRSATIVWTTDEPADSTVSYGTSPPLTTTLADDSLGVGHAIELSGLRPGTSYLFSVRSEDVNGFALTDDNGGAHYAFNTPAPYDLQSALEWPGYQNSGAHQGASVEAIVPPLQPLWSVSGGGVNTAPVVAGGTVYTVEGTYVRARAASNGALVWERYLSGYLSPMGTAGSTPLVSGDRLYASVTTRLPDGNGGWISKGILYALRTSDGHVVWTYAPEGEGIDTSFKIAWDNGRLFAMKTDPYNKIVAVNAADGAELWNYYQPGLFPAMGAAVGDGKVFVPMVSSGGGGNVTALDAGTGMEVWTRGVSDTALGQVPLYAQGTVYAGGGITAYQSTSTFAALNATDGAIRWRIPGLEPVLSAPAYDGSRIFFATADVAGNLLFMAVDSSSGDPLWSQAVSTGAIPYAASSLTYANGHLYAISDPGVLRVLEAETGAIVDTDVLTEQTDKAHLAIAGQSVFVQGKLGTLLAFQAAEDSQAPNIAVTPASYAFAAQAIGDSSSPQTLTISNTGTMPLVLGGRSIVGANPADFVMGADTCPASLAPSESCTVQVTFAPKATGSRSGTLSIVSNDPDTPLSVALTGSSQRMAYTMILRPNADAGPNQATPTPSGPHYANVDDDPHDGDTSILSFSAAGHKEVFTIPDQLLDNDVIKSVKVRWVAKKGSGNDWQAKAGLVVGSQEYYGTTVNLSSGYVVREETFANNPATGLPWTAQEVRSAKLVYQQVTITTQLPKAALTEIVMVVTVHRVPASVTLTELPNADAGPNQGSPMPSGPHYLNVDDNPHDGDTSILQFSMPADKEVFTTGDQTLDGDIITSVRVRWVARKGAGDDWQGRAGLVIGSQEYFGNPVTLTDNYTTREEIFPHDPATGQLWTVQSARNAKLVFDLIMATGELPDASLTQIVLVIDVLRIPLPATVMMRPNADASPNQGTPTPSGPHYTTVDDDPHDGDSSVLSFSSVGHKEVFTTIDQLVDSDIVQNVKVRWAAKKGSGNGWQAKAGLKVNGVEAYGPAVTLPTNYSVREELFTSNPATGQPWTVAEVRAAMLVYQQTGIATQLPKAKLTEIVLVVNIGRAP